MVEERLFYFSLFSSGNYNNHVLYKRKPKFSILGSECKDSNYADRQFKGDIAE